MPIISSLGRQRQEDSFEFKTNLVYIVYIVNFHSEF